MDEEYVPILYPAYIEEQYRERTLAYFENFQIVTEHGLTLSVENLSTLLITLFDHNLLTFMQSIPTFPWLAELVALEHRVDCSEQGMARSIRIKGARNTSRMLVGAASWGADELSVDWLQRLRSLYQTTQVGTPASPGSLGQALFRKSFKERYGEDWQEHRHRRPPGPYSAKIRQESSGARSEVFHLNVAFDMAYEHDQHNGYGAALAQAQPAGKTYRVRGNAVINYLFYFIECEVHIVQPLRLGCFPVRVGESRYRHPTFPTAPGSYRTWLWKEEIELARREGCTVKTLAGFGWKVATTDFAPYVESIARLRDSAPPEIAALLKLALVASVGHLGMPEDRYTIVSSKDRKYGDRCLSDAGLAYNWWIHQEQDPYPQSMPHIFSRVLMLCRLSLYEMAKRCMEEELNIIATNTDAVITERKLAAIPMKGAIVKTGDWTALELTNVIVPANRHLHSDQKNVSPGVPKKRKV